MSAINRPAKLNRGLIGLVGAALIAAGVLALVAHYGRLGWVDSDAPLVPGTGGPPTWVLWVTIAGAVVLGLLCLRWLFAQLFRMPKTEVWRVGTDTGTGTTTLESGTAADAVADDIESYPGVRSAAAWLSGPGDAPELHLTVTAETFADIAELRKRILGHAVARLREALEVTAIPVTLELDLAQGRGKRHLA
ncbi:alkaline shock response membrane anchor protein AmaP [Nocardia puris]|uniref:Uncharacterized protein n=1 Tax=Nocardia puris TaxID=208602 RepID=A0A366DU66_9NOCA|nr:hypothetical protein [Nocardia puris]MBF6210211.1 alkaline shock response membrane anchor protein AmaP [Nocardia puris]MBF6367289.1 alkaline shock response membrane anchor protein AmaP [Nocardia puris]MBF6457472.1 alkaline shock response membrane anchor protein AmaP [Nocardia puris]RBO93627.1 hypothetical protein DFR74_10243 [Nocardia puris]